MTVLIYISCVLFACLLSIAAAAAWMINRERTQLPVKSNNTY